MEPKIAFFGATGGCTLACLVNVLQSESPTFQVQALARTPDKLRNLLTERGIPDETIQSRLRIIEGGIRDDQAVQATIRFADQTAADKIMFGVGGTPVLRFHLYPVTLNDPSICYDGLKKVLDAYKSVTYSTPGRDNHRAHVIVISTTGISKTRDVPLAFTLLYHWLLAVPHVDKKKMEALLPEASNLVDWTAVRPSLLQDGAAAPLAKIREGWEQVPPGSSTGPGPAIGYTITRDSVGSWVFQRLMRGGPAESQQWFSKAATITE